MRLTNADQPEQRDQDRHRDANDTEGELPWLGRQVQVALAVPGLVVICTVTIVEELERPDEQSRAWELNPFTRLPPQSMAELRQLLLAEFLGDLPDWPEESLVRRFERVMGVCRNVHQDVRNESDQEERDEVLAPVAGPDPDDRNEKSGYDD